MNRRSHVWRGLTLLGASLLSVSLLSGMILETYRTSVDSFTGTRSQKVVTNGSGGSSWTYKSEFKTAKQAYEGWKSFAIKQSQESTVLLKNNDSALPISKHAKITLFGVRSYAPVYGSSMGSVADGNSTVQIFDAFKQRGFDVNPTMLATYRKYFKGQKWSTPKYGNGAVPEYASITKYNDPCEISLAKLKKLNPNYNKDYSSYNDAAVVVVGRPGGESGDGYYTGSAGLAKGVSTTTGNILSLSTEEKEILKEAEANFNKVIVLVNSVNPMEIADVQDDPNVDAVMWIGYPGSYGFYGVADALNGTVSPSGHLGDVYAKNSAVSPAAQNYGNIAWSNASSFSEDANVNSYLIDAEGIYSGYRYYETRYDDIVNGNGGSQASAGTYANSDGTAATASGTWNYSNEVVYPFGYGLSYTTFSRKLDKVKVSSNRKKATVAVTVKNTGKVAAKDVIQLYAQAPYTQYDQTNGVEKSAIQLMDFEKTKTLKPGASQTITMDVDMSNLASYDSAKAKTYIVDPGTYYFAIGSNSHEALNNILAAQGRTTSSGMTADGDASQTYSWEWTGDVDSTTFATSSTGTKITNQFSSGNYATDYNAFESGTVTYLSRSDWNGTFPKTYSGLTANAKLTKLLKNDFISLKKNQSASNVKLGTGTSKLTINDMKGASFNDSRWNQLINKVSIKEFLNFASLAFHNIEAIPSVGLANMIYDDGPLGSDSHYLSEGTYQGEAYSDASKYANYSSRVTSAPVNLAYSWNKELAYENGSTIIGESSLVFNLPMMCAPAMNLHRTAYNARAVEYYSEDPILSGFIGSNVTQGAQSKGTLVQIKHFAFNDQEINRSGVATFMNEQKARELELRNFQQAFENKGEAASFKSDKTKKNAFTLKPLGVMTSYNRIGAVASSANKAAMVNVLRNEWGFKGYNVTDFTSVTLKAAPKESLLAGTTAFCGFGVQGITYWNEKTFASDSAMTKALRQDIHYTLYALANSNALNGLNSSSHSVNTVTWWRAVYGGLSGLFVIITFVGIIGYAVEHIRERKRSAGALNAAAADTDNAASEAK